MIPSWIPWHLFWAYFVGCALLAAAASLTARKFVRLSSTLLGLMFFLFVCLIHIPNALAHPKNRFAWTYALRDLSFAGGAWALAGLHSRASSPQLSRWMILFGRIVIGIAAIFFAVEHFLHPEFAPGVPLEKMTPAWVPFPSVWGYLAGSDPAGRWNRPGPEQEIPHSRNLDWRTHDRPHCVPLSADLDPRPGRNNAGDHGGDQLRL